MKLDYSSLRKRLQSVGEAPSWYTTGGLQLFYEKYSYKEETPKSRYMSIANAMAKHAPKVKPDWWEQDEYTAGKDWNEVFFNTMWDGYVSPSTPLLANGGLRKRGTTVACSNGYVGDNLYDRYNAITEAAVLTKHSHGTSYSIDDWPHEGKELARGGRSLGVMPIIRDFIACMDEVTQASRRGSLAYSIGLDHGDFWKVKNFLYENPESNNVGWLIKDKTVAALNANDKEMVERLNATLAVKMPRGKGYYTFIDKMNRSLAPVFKDKGLTTKSSNLCVAPETQILTRHGCITISKLEGQTVDIWNGEEWSPVVVTKTGVDKEMISVSVKTYVDGKYECTRVLRCTPYHKWYDGDGKEIRTFQLEEGTDLLSWYAPNGKLHSAVVESLDATYRSDTFCFKEVKRGMGVFNGILTGQCQECNLPADENYTFSCVIICYNLEHFRTWPKHLIHVGQIMSDCNVTEYLETIDQMSEMDKQAMRKIRKFTSDFRALGSGVLAYHTLMQQEMIPVASMEAMALNNEIFSKLDKESREATEWLATVQGEPEGCKGYGIRNATRLMMPPTKSTAEIMAGASEGIGLDVAMVFTKQSAGGEFFRINKVLLNIMKERGVYNDDEVMKIAKAKGSVQKVDWLSADEKKVFLTAFEIPMEWVVRLASQRQKYIDQAQSINLYFTSNDSEEYIGKIHKQAFNDEGILSLYYIYSTRGADGLTRDLEGCEMCQ